VTDLAKANAIVKDFQDGKTQYLVANPRKGGMGIDLPQCDYMIFYESPVTPITRQQAEARPMSRGARPLFIDDLVISPVERRILEWIGEGKDLMKSLSSARRSFARK
jgi:SNF2 family DNA or RNA helicase